MAFLGLKVHRRERGITLLLIGYFFIVVATHYLLKPARNSMFLEALGADSLPYVYLLTALAIWPLVAVYSRLVPGRRLTRVLAATLAFLVSNLLLFWFFLPRSGDWLYGAFYVWVKLYAVLLPSQFWLMANELLDPRQGKRLFGPIGAGGVLGGIAGSAFVGLGGTEWFGTENLLLVAAFVLASAVPMLLAISRSRFGRQRLSRASHGDSIVLDESGEAEQPGFSRPSSEAGSSDGNRGGEGERGKHLLRAIATLLVLLVIVHTIIDWQFNRAAEIFIDDENARTAFFGRFFTILNLVTLAIQVLATGAVLRVFGVGVALLAMPIFLAAGSLAIFLLPVLGVVSVVRATDDALRYSLDQSAREVLFLPVPSALRARMKPRIDMVASRVANGLGGILILAAVWLLDEPLRPLSLVCMVLVGAWIVAALRARRLYSSSLQELLEVRDIDVDHLVRARVDSGARDAVRAGLSSDDEETVAAALGLAERTTPAEFSEELIRLVRGRSHPDTVARALRLLNEAGEAGALDEALELVKETGNPVRPEAIAYACSLGTPTTRDEIEDMLESADPELMAAAAVCLLEQGDPDRRHEAIRILEELAERRDDDRVGSRTAVADIIRGRRSLDGFEDLLRQLLDDPDPSVVRSALSAAAQHRALGFVADVCRVGALWPLQGAALRCLSQYGQPATGPLTGVLADPRNPRRMREFAARALSRIGGKAACEALLAGLAADDRAVRWAALKALNHLRRRGMRVGIGAERERATIRREWRDLLALYRLAGAIGRPGLQDARQFVGTVLQDRIEEATERLFRALALRHSLQSMFYAYRALASGDREARPHAIELIDNTVEGPLRRKLVSLLEAAALQDKADLACRELDEPAPESLAAALRELVDPGDPWLAACALRAMDPSDREALPEGLLQDVAATGNAAARELLERYSLLPRAQVA